MQHRTGVLALALGLGSAFTASAQEGMIEINHARALAGGVTGSDTPGYPVTIDAPGSYRLTGNLNAPNADTDIIRVVAPDVTIQLSGFLLLGASSCNQSPTGPVCTPGGGGKGIFSNSYGTTIRNGVLQGFASTGIDIAGAAATVEDVSVFGTGGPAISVGEGFRVQRCNLAVVGGGVFALPGGGGGLVLDSVIRDAGRQFFFGNGVAANDGFVAVRNVILFRILGNNYFFRVNSVNNLCDNSAC
jgi:hypothetical protein